jgi:hypothetical protein
MSTYLYFWSMKTIENANNNLWSEILQLPRRAYCECVTVQIFTSQSQTWTPPLLAWLSRDLSAEGLSILSETRNCEFLSPPSPV